MRKVRFLFLIVLLSACRSNLGGTTYSDELGLSSYKFESDGRVYVSALGVETELKYELNGNKIKLEGPQGNVILTLLEDGSLQGPGGEKLTNQTAKQQNLVGLWEKASSAGYFPTGGTLELTKDGGVKVSAEVEGKLRTIEVGTYQIRGNTLQMTSPDEKHIETLIIQTLTDQRLVLVDQKKREDAFKRKR